MARAKTIVELLSEQPVEELARMREANEREEARLRAELANVEMEGRMIVAALSKRGKPGRPGKLTPEMVLGAAASSGEAMTAADVHKALGTAGLDVSVNAVRNHLNRLVESGDLGRDENKKYVVPEPAFAPFVMPATTADFPAAAADDDIPF